VPSQLCTKVRELGLPCYAVQWQKWFTRSCGCQLVVSRGLDPVVTPVIGQLSKLLDCISFDRWNSQAKL
jgi:hypothetical protein